MKLLKAEYVLPVSGEPIHRGAVAFEKGKIVSVGPADALAAEFADAEIEDFGNAAITPGLVNCHSHLEITGMRGALDDVDHDFTSWLLRLTKLRSEMSDEQIAEWAYAGALEGASAGVTCFGDIGRVGEAGIGALKRAGLRGIVYQETQFSAENERADDDFRALGERFETLLGAQTDLVKIGLSPHATYTVSSRLFELIAQYSIINRIPLAIHAAESLDEYKLLTSGEGSFTAVYEKYGVEWNAPMCTPIEYLERLGVLSARPLLVHCVKVTESDVKRIAANGATIAHCPRSNAKFGHGSAPLGSFLAAGVAAGIGSDSVASNNICDILAESSFAALAARIHATSPAFLSAGKVLEMATIDGARALRLDDTIGTLEAGKAADIAVFSLAGSSQQPLNDVESALAFSTNGSHVVCTIVGGEAVYAA